MTDREKPDYPQAQVPDCIAILVVDDEPEVVQVTRLVLSRYRYQGRGLEIIAASSADGARQILRQRNDIAVILLDVVMESDDAGLKLVEYIRQTLGNHHIRIVLRTGQPGYAPEHRIVQDYDINDYLMKADATQSRLTVSLTTAIRGYFDILRAGQLARQVERSHEERDSAHQASLLKTQFLAHMSHEIRTPLNGVVGIIELLAETPVNEDQEELIRDLKLSADALLGVINDVLDVSKIEAGKLELSETAFYPPELFDKVCAVFTAVMRRKGIVFSCEPESFPGAVFIADVQRIQQILINFLGNANKFTPEGGRITLRGGYRQIRSGEWQLYAAVEDTGAGIREDRLRGIFEAYEQENAHTSAHYGGTGLGLALSRTLAELMGGSVGADSQPGHGSRFWLAVPLRVCNEPVVEDDVADNERGDECLQGCRILLAEDDKTSQKVLKRMLQNLGAEVSCYDNGQELIDSGQAAGADIIVLDYYMPLLDGPSCAAVLREQGVEVPMLALTAAVTASDHQACLQAGINEVHAKPLDRERLVSWLVQQKNKRRNQALSEN